VYFEGNGSNIIYIDWDNDIVAVVRWIQGGPPFQEFVAKLLSSLKTPPATAQR
jgi:hypothetical protein